MRNIKKIEKTPKKRHADFVRMENERCFLKNKQEVKYHSFIILEIVPLEKINQLIEGLDNLYANASLAQTMRLNYKEILSNSHSKLFQLNTMRLPYLTTMRVKSKVIPNCVFHDLGNNIRHMHICIYKVLPSTIILQIQVYLEEKVSKKINKVIYKYHKEKKEPIKTPRGNYTNIYGPENQKEAEIYQIKKSFHKEAFDFLKTYFKGYFFELAEEDPCIIPSIDLFSFNYPDTDEDILNYGTEYSGFFHCFNTYIIPPLSFRYENYLLTFENSRDRAYNNYLIFANRKNSKNNIYPNIDIAIEQKLGYCCFDLFAIDRLVKLQERNVGNLNLTVSQEIENIQSNEFDKVIESRKHVIKRIFSFERFSAEFKRYSFHSNKFPFKTLIDKERPEKQIELFKDLKQGIEASIKEINDLISGFTRQYETILNLKNIEFNRNMQRILIWLTIVIIVLAVVQLIIVLGPRLNIIILIIKFLIGG